MKTKSKTVSRAYLNKVKAELLRTRKNWLNAEDRAEAFEQELQDYGIDTDAVYANYREWNDLDDEEN